jgi:hypothetical protein
MILCSLFLIKEKLDNIQEAIERTHFKHLPEAIKDKGIHKFVVCSPKNAIEKPHFSSFFSSGR